MLKKINEKKVLHKVKKQWVVLGTALLAFATTGAYSEIVHADAGDNHSSTVLTAKSATDSSAASTTTAAADNASSESSAATSQAQTDQSNGSSTVSSASQPATTTLQTEDRDSQTTSAATTPDDDISFRDGDATSTNGSTSYPISNVNASLTTSNPSISNSLGTSNIYTSNGSSTSIGIAVNNPGSYIYNQNISGASYTILYANNGSNAQINGINSLVQHVQLSGQSEVSYVIKSADYSSYASFNSNYTSESRSEVSDANVEGQPASSASILVLNSGPIGSGDYRPGDKVWWTFDVDKNSNFSGSENTLNYPSTISNNITPLQFKYVDKNGSEIASSQWITGNNIYPGNTYSVNVPNKINNYVYNGETNTSIILSNPTNISKNGDNYVVSGTFNHWSDSPIVLTLTYDKLPTKTVNINYYDVNNGNLTPISGASSASLSGYADEQLSYSTQSIVDSLTNEGYELTSSSPSASNSITVNSDANSNTYNFNFTHKKVIYNASEASYPSGLNQADLTQTFTRTINFVNANTKQPVRDSAAQTVTYNRSAVYDEVTKSASYGNWTTNDGSFAEYAAPSIDGYNNPQPASVAAQSVFDDTQQSSFSASIEYTKRSAAKYSGTVKFLDADANNSEVATGSFSVPVDAQVNYSSTIDSLTSKGYKLTSDSPAVSFAIQSSDNDYVFKLAHNTSNYDANSTSYPASLNRYDFNKTFTRTINFVNANTKQPVRDSAAQTVTYNRSAVYDEVTKSASYGNWTTNDGSFAEYAAPSIDGYNNPQPESVAAQLVSDDTQQSSFSASIEYTKRSAAEFNGTVKFLDADAKNQEIASNETFSGSDGAIVQYSTKSVVDSLTAKGYKLVSGTPSDSLTINDSNNDSTFTFAHNTSNYDANSSSYPASLNKEDFTKTFTRTINFVNANTKQPVRDSAAQTVTYNRSAVYDEVTKSASYGNWTTNDGSFAEYAAPSIDGYNNPQPASVAAQSVFDDTQQSSFNASIEYTKRSAEPVSPATTTPYVAPSSAVSYAPFSFYSAPSSVASSSSVIASSVASSTASSVTANAIKMYNNKTKLVKHDDQILIFIQPKYAPNDANGSLSDQYVVNQQLANGQISHDQKITLAQYNAMLTASGKQPYTPETLNEAYIQRNEDNNIMTNKLYKTTFDANVVKQGNNVLIDTNTSNNGFNKPADNKLVVVTAANRVAKNASNKHNATKKKAHKKKAHKKAQHSHKHAKKAEHHVTKHTHYIKHDRKQK